MLLVYFHRKHYKVGREEKNNELSVRWEVCNSVGLAHVVAQKRKRIQRRQRGWKKCNVSLKEGKDFGAPSLHVVCQPRRTALKVSAPVPCLSV